MNIRTIDKDSNEYLRSKEYLEHIESLGINAVESSATIYKSCDASDKKITITIGADSVRYDWVDSRGFKWSHIITKTTNRVIFCRD